MTSTDEVAEGFGTVADAFHATIEGGGASLSIWRDGEPVVELAAGEARPGRAFSQDTLAVVYSCTKGVASLVIARLIETGRLPGYDTPIGDVWPEFAAHGKGSTSIGDVLAHRAGVSAPRRALSRSEVLDPLLMADALAAQEPLWVPGDSHQYHAVTHGALTAKLAHIATGETVGELVRSEIAEPLEADFWIGVPASRADDVADITPPSEPVPAAEPGTDEYWLQRTIDMGGALGFDDFAADPEVREAEFPGVNGVGTATGLARIWSAAVTPTRGRRVIESHTFAELVRLRSGGQSHFLAPPPRQAWGAGVMVPSDWEWYLTPWSAGHDGAGGQVAFGDPSARIGFAYLTSRLQPDWSAGQAIVDALARVLT